MHKQRLALAGASALHAIFWLLMIFEGAVRKWLLAGFDAPIQILRDVLPALSLALILQSNSRLTYAPKVLVGAVLLYAFFCGLAFFVSALDYPALVPILGLRTHLAYIPLLVIVPALYGELRDIEKAMNWMAALSLPISLLCVYQTTQSPYSPINLYASGEAANARFGNDGLVRASGTFSYITGMAHYSALVFGVALAGLLLGRTRKIQVGFILALLGSFVAAASTGSRGPLVQMLGIFLVSGAFVWKFRVQVGRKLRPLLAWLGIGSVAALIFAGLQLSAMYERVSTVSDDTGLRASSALFDWIGAIVSHPIGYGLGTGHQKVSQLLGGEAGFALGAEEEMTRIALELGFLGFLAFLFCRLLIGVQLFKFIRAINGFELRIIGAVAMSLFLAHITAGVYTPIANASLWGAAGFVLAARRVDRYKTSALA